MTFRTLLGLSSLALAGGCASQGVLFEGHAEPRLARAGDLEEMSAMPEGYERVGRVAARCTLVDGARPEEGSRLIDVDCTQSRLMSAIREKAAEVGGEVLVGRHCRSRIGSQDESSTTLHISCDAEVARPTGASLHKRPLLAGVMSEDSEPRAAEAWHIRVFFAPALGAAARPPRAADGVSQAPLFPVGNKKLGDIVTRCEDHCTKEGARVGLMAAAGRMGASDVVDLSCVAEGEGYSCSAIATAPEVDPELDARAR